LGTDREKMDFNLPDTYIHQHPEIEISGKSEISAEETQRILLERAKEYAEVSEGEFAGGDSRSSGETIRLVTFLICGENYGIGLSYVNEVRILPRITPIPCTPIFVKGAVNIRGKIFSVVDVRTFLNISSSAQNEFKKVLIVEAAGLELGILVDDVISVVDVPLAEINPPADVLLRSRKEHIRGVYISGDMEESATEEMLIILDVESLFSTPDIIVNEEI